MRGILSAFILLCAIFTTQLSAGSSLYERSSEKLSNPVNLFSGGNVNAGSKVSLGDIVGTLFIGGASYVLIIVPFIVALFSVSAYFFKDPKGGQNENISGMNFIRLALKPVFWLVVGALAFGIFKIFLEGWYDIDIGSRIKFFFEARYDTIVDNLTTTGVMLKSTKTLLLALDIFSKFAFWSIALIMLLLYGLAFFLFIAVYIESGNSDSSIIKRVLSSVWSVLILVVIITLYSQNATRVMFVQEPVIEKIGQVKSTEEIVSKVVKYWIKIGLTKV